MPLSIDLSKRTPDQEQKEQKLQSFLGKPMRVTITDGRIMSGRFHCFDNQSNIILVDTFQLLNGAKTRRLGQVLITGKHVLKCEVDASSD
mmetsp:Transcript_37880/g.74514  ORF Transcript_37880/g.74514 Transcript_37880/m.74514 type:complete len:90 (-) Transcript_37880:136-405(-)